MTPQPDLTVVVIRGGLPGGVRTAAGGGRRWSRDPDERTSAFVARVTEDATKLGLSRVIVGGLPEQSVGDAA